MNKNAKIILTIIIVPIIFIVYYRMFFSSFDNNSIVEYKVVLTKNPEYHDGAVRASPSWYFKTKNMTFELDNINPLDITKQEILQIKKGDTITIYSYEYISFSSFFRKLDGRVIIHGLKTSKLNKFYPSRIQQGIRDLDVQVFWGIHFLVLFGGYAILENKNKKNTTITQ